MRAKPVKPAKPFNNSTADAPKVLLAGEDASNAEPRTGVGGLTLDTNAEPNTPMFVKTITGTAGVKDTLLSDALWLTYVLVVV